MSEVLKSYSVLEIKSIDSEERVLSGLASLPNIDRDGDLVDPMGIMHRGHIPLLFNHDPTKPIGHLTSIKSTAAGMEIEAVIAKDSGLDWVEQSWKMIKSGVMRGLSIGFKVLEAQPIKTGRKFIKTEMFECSAVVIPSCAEATILTVKQYSANPVNADDQMVDDVVEKAAEPNQTAALIDPPTLKSKSDKGIKTMSISSKIEAAQADLTEVRDRLYKALEESNDTQESIDERTELQSEFSRKEANLDLLQKAEQSVANVAAETVAKSVHKAPGIISSKYRKEGDFDLLVKSAVSEFTAFVNRESVESAIERRYGNDEAVKAVSAYISKGVQNIATTTDAGWAAELTTQAVGDFQDLLEPESIVAQLPLERYNFGGNNKIVIPMRADRTKDIGGSFRGEGAPIKVKGASLSSKYLTPKSMAVISTFSEELARYSNPQIESLIRRFIIADTAVELDKAFLGATTGTVIEPAGMTAGLLAGDKRDSAGATAPVSHDKVVADLRASYQAMASANLGRRLAWVMHPSRSVGLSMLLSQQGSVAFPSLANNVLFGAPVFTSTNADPAQVLLIDCSEIAIAMGAPSFDISTQAVIHEEDANPQPIGKAGAPAVVAAPARSLWQTNSVGVRMLLDVDFTKMRGGSVQQINKALY